MNPELFIAVALTVTFCAFSWFIGWCNGYEHGRKTKDKIWQRFLVSGGWARWTDDEDGDPTFEMIESNEDAEQTA